MIYYRIEISMDKGEPVTSPILYPTVEAAQKALAELTSKTFKKEFLELGPLDNNLATAVTELDIQWYDESEELTQGYLEGWTFELRIITMEVQA